MNRRLLSGLTAVMMLAGVFTACSSSTGNDPEETEIKVISGTQAPDDLDTEPENSDNTDGSGEGDVTDVPTEKKKSDTKVSKATTSTDENGDIIVTTSAGTTAKTELYGLDDPEEEMGTELVTAATTAATKGEEYYETMTEASVNEENVIEKLVIKDKQAIMTSYNVDPTTRYGYNQLSSSEQKLYLKILDCAKNVERNVDTGDISYDTWIKVFGVVYQQEPELFWLSSKNKLGKLYFWEIDKDVIDPLQKKIDSAVSDILAKAQGKSDYEKVEIFHDSIVLNNDFMKAAEDDSDDYWKRYTIYGGFVDGMVQCEGYAKSMQYLCDLAGIESMVVVGTNSAGSSHAWNVIKLDGKWYNVDCTWDDPILSTPVKNNLRHRYFAVPDEWIHNKSHFNVNKKTTGTEMVYFAPPSCTSTDKNYFSANGRLFSDASSAEKSLKEELKKAASNKTRVAEIRVSSKKVYDEVTKNLVDYSKWIKSENSSVKKVASNCDENTLVIELDLTY